MGKMTMDNMTIGEIKQWRSKKKQCKNIGEFKTLARNLRDKHNLTDMQALNILNDRIITR